VHPARLILVLVVTACTTRPTTPRPAPAGFPPLGIGGDYLSYRKLTPAPFLSRVHGNRWVDVYVNELGADAYLDGTEIPVGTVVVKSSREAAGGKPSDVPGPIYVMRKEKPGYAPEHDDWYFAIYWARPTPEQAKKLGGPIYWQSPSAKAAYCWDCHDSYDRDLGGLVPSSLLLR
jgi:Cytochrome P460